MRRRFKSIFKKDSVEETKADGKVPVEQSVLVNKKDNVAHHDESQTTTTDKSNLENEALSGHCGLTSTSLWDTAYDQLKEEEGTRELLATYEGLLSGVPMEGTAVASSRSNSQPEDGTFENLIPQNDPIARRKVLNEIAKAGMQHMKDNQTKLTILGHQISMQEGAGKVGNAVDWANTFVTAVVKDLPYAPAVTAGISLILPLLKNPAATNDANLQGFAYVTSQMGYYAQMEAQLLPADMSPGLKVEMTNGVIELYRLIIEYQTRSVLRFYRSSTKNYLRSVVSYDGWEDQLSQIKDKEATLGKRFETVFSSSSLAQLKELSEEAKAMRQTLNNDLQRLVDLSQNAEQRLSDEDFRRCVDALKVVNPEHDKDRIQDEKGGLLKDSYRWVVDHAAFKGWRDEEDSHLLWIKGDPGKGKTMLLCGIIDELSKSEAQNANIAYFFCQATNSRIREASAVLRGLIYTLVHRQHSLIVHLQDGRFEGDTAWFELRKVLTKILDDPDLKPTYLIVDALDECEVDLDKLLDFLVEKSSAHPRVKWIISSRNLPDIERDLERTPKSKLCLELNEDTVTAAVDHFIDYKVNDLSQKNRYDPEIRAAVHQHLKSNAEGTFLWVALVCQRIAKVAGRHVRKKLDDNPPGLTALYRRMLDQIDQSDDADYCKSILSVALTVFRPITLEELPFCIDLPQEIRGNVQDLEEILRNCGSFLTLRENIISLVHQSAKDFLTEKPVFDMIFPGGTTERHYSIFCESMLAMSGTLRRDIYDLAEPGFPVYRLQQQHPDPLAAMHYSCLHWVRHFQQSIFAMNAKDDLQDSGLVGNFFRQDYLHWLEVLSLLRSLPMGVASMLDLESFLKKLQYESCLIERVEDACRFILYFKTGLESYPLQVYSSALIFSPTSSITRNQFGNQKPLWLAQDPVVEKAWGACLHTFEALTYVSIVALSHASDLIASASGKMIELWDTSNGERVHNLRVHDNSVQSVFFPHDSAFLASVGCDWTVQLWDLNTGDCVHTIHDNAGGYDPYAISPSLKLLAFGSDSKASAIKIWDINRRQCVQTLETDSHVSKMISFSHDSKLLVSASAIDCSTKIWDCHSGQCLHTLESHEKFSFALSRDSKTLASTSSSDGTILKLWDLSSGECTQTFEVYGRFHSPVVFSHDSSLLACLSDQTTIKVWDIKSGKCLHTFQGHAGSVESLEFSHDSRLLASGSGDKTVKVWSIGSQQYTKVSQEHTNDISSLTFSGNSKLLVSCSEDNTIKVWNTNDWKCIQTLSGHGDTDKIQSVAISHDSRLLAACTKTFTDSSKIQAIATWIKLWDIDSGRYIRTVELDNLMSLDVVVFSFDAKFIASNSWTTLKVWNTSDGQCIWNLDSHTRSVHSAAFSEDSKLLASGSSDTTVKLWDLSGGECIRTFEGHFMTVNSLRFSPDSRLLASHSCEGVVKIWNTTDGCCLKTIDMRGSVPWIISTTSASIKLFDASIGYLRHDFGVIKFNCNLHEASSKADDLLETPSHTDDLLETSSNTNSVLDESGDILNADDEIPILQGLSLSQDESWITWNSERLLWLPPDYRPRSVAVSLSKVVFAHRSGRMLFFDFDCHKLAELFPKH